MRLEPRTPGLQVKHLTTEPRGTLTTQEAFGDTVDQDETAQNMQSDLWSTLSTFFILDYNYTVSSSCNGSVFLANEIERFIYSVVREALFVNCIDQRSDCIGCEVWSLINTIRPRLYGW